MKKQSWIMYLVGAILLGALVWLVHTRVHFQWSVFRDELQHVDWRRIIFAVALIIFCYWLRAIRWAVLIRPQRRSLGFLCWARRSLVLLLWLYLAALQTWCALTWLRNEPGWR